MLIKINNAMTSGSFDTRLHCFPNKFAHKFYTLRVNCSEEWILLSDLETSGSGECNKTIRCHRAIVHKKGSRSAI